jgi:FixJ family two-component response regulator
MNKEIATELRLSTRTVEDRRAKMMKKMGAKSLAELVQLVMTH